MRALLLGLSIALAAAAPVAAQTTSKDTFGKEHTGKVDWVFGFDKGAEEAKWSGRPMMVFFTATG